MQPSTPPATPDRPDATGGELGGTPQGGNTAQGNTQMPPGTGNAPQRSAQQPDAQVPGKANRNAQDSQGKQQDRMQGQNAQRNEPAAATGTGTAESGTTRTKSTQTTTNTTNNTNVNITSEKRTTIKQTITQTHVGPVRDVNFSVNVGVAIPHTVELHPLPPRVVEIVPQYRNYRYFVLADGRIVIVQPDTYEIVYVVA
ncbi:MAG: hypothetical protein K0S00_3007 [Xanthobacteraceae bacterium]|jgi:hypothetical protein|nr:hypothetical protein [Xanthobacteraceae bacterium]